MGDLSEPMRTVKASADRVAQDFTSTTGVDMDYIIFGPEDNGLYLCGNGPMGVYVPGGDVEQFVADVADKIGEWVTETLANMGRLEEARTWPRCPEHEHALDPVVLEGIAVWKCRDDPAIATRIGDLGPTHNEGQPLTEYVGYVWKDDLPRIDFKVEAKSLEEAKREVLARYGEGFSVSIWNEEDARRPR